MRQNKLALVAVAIYAASAFAAHTAFADAAPAWRKAPENTFQLSSFTLARRVEDRKPAEEVDGTIAADGQRIYAYVEAFNKGTTRALKVIWKRGQTVHHQATLTVKRSPSWRTWAYIEARPFLKGAWTVHVLDDTGKELGSKSFTIE